jgi:hypothetical protein
MTMIDSRRSTIQPPEPEYLVDDAQLAAAAFLARYSGRTLEAYRHDLRGFFQWAADNAIAVLEVTRPHIELFRCWMENAGWRRRRLTAGSTVCGSIGLRTSTDGSRRIRPSTSATPGSTRLMPGVSTARSSACSCSRPSRKTATRGTWCAPPPQRAAGQRSVRRQHRGAGPRAGPPNVAHPWQGQQASHRPARSPHGAHHRPGRGRAL